MTALLLSLRETSVWETFYFIVSRGPNINACDHSGRAALHVAIRKDYALCDYINILLEKDNIDVNMRDRSGSTPLMRAVRKRRIETVNTLLPQKRPETSK